MKVRRVDICDFRGFPGPARYEFDLGNAGNVVVYGENGSGKSSLFRAIEEFFNLDSKAKEFSTFKNVFSDPNLTDGTVTVYFDNGTASIPISWGMGAPRQISDPRVTGSSIRLGCIDYRALLRTNFLHHGDKVNLFSLAVSHLLAHYPVNVRGRSTTIGELWRRVELLKPKNHRGNNREIARNALGEFNSTFQPIIPMLGAKTEELLARFPDCEFKLTFNSAVVEYDETKRDYTGKKLELEVHFNGVPITSHQHFLNEAKLSGIALAVYFAGLLISIPPVQPGATEYPKLLVLDDVLIGLDLAHRLPILKLVEEEFVDKGWQSLVFTFDRAWYEIAKQQLRASHWSHLELFAIRVGDHEQPLLVPDHEHLYRALAFLEAGQVKAAGVHVRTAFEILLRHFCQLLGASVKFHPDPRKVPAADLWGALKSQKYQVNPPLQYVFDRNGIIHVWQPQKREEPVVPLSLQKRIEHAVSWVLNPLSHSQAVDRYRVEIEDAIYAIDELESAVKRALAPPTPSPPIAFESIISLLKAHIEKLKTSGGSI
jgi:energy-coupling factor transporter ATP-binding protein EcfA2